MTPTGIPIVGEVPWGTHFCHFYEDRQDLIDILVPYFKAGLENNELCVWIACDPLTTEIATAALGREVGNLDGYIRTGQIEILDHNGTYTNGETFSGHSVMTAWLQRLEGAGQRGFKGLRVTGNVCGLEAIDWQDFVGYEALFDCTAWQHRMIAVCSYNLAKRGPLEIMEAVSNHAFAVVKRAGRWQVIENAARKKVEASLRLSEERLRIAVESTELGTFDFDPSSGTLIWSDICRQHFGLPPGSEVTYDLFLQCLHPDDRDRIDLAVRQTLEPTSGGHYAVEYRTIGFEDRRERFIRAMGRAIFDPQGKPVRFVGTTLDITGRKRREANLAFLASMADEFSGLSTAQEIMQAIGEKLGAYLNASDCLFAEIDEANDRAIVEHTSRSADMPAVVGEHRLSDFVNAEFRRQARAGETIVVCDTATDSRNNHQLFAERQIHAYVTVPFRRDGKWKYLLTVNSATPRDWRDDEVEVIRELANRAFPRLERARAEQALSEATERVQRQARLFEGVASTTPDFVYIFDRQGRFLYANRRLLEVWGMTLSDAAGKTCLELGYERWHHDMHMREIAQVIATKLPIIGEVPFKAPLTGVFGVYEYIFTPVLGSDGEVEIIAGTTRDVTTRKRAEEALRDSEERFRALVTTTSDAVYRISPDWEEVRYLSGAEFLAGSEQMSRRGMEQHIHPDDLAQVRSAIAEAIRTQGTFMLEHRIVRADGSVGWTFSRAIPLTNGAGEIVEWFGAATDITPRKQAEAALLASEARERARAAELGGILQAAPVALFIAQDPEGRNVIGSRMTYDLLRLSPGDNVSLAAQAGQVPPPFRAIREGRQIQPHELPVHQAAASGRPVRNYEFEIVYSDGTSRNMLGDAVPLFNDEGQPRGAVAAFVDITERKRNEERLRQTQKLESIGLLAGGIAHDFNNLLVGVIGGASLAMDMVPPDSEAIDLLERVVKTGEQLAHLTRQLLAYSGKGKFVVEPLNLSVMVPEIVELIQPSISKKIALHLDLDRDLPPIEADRGQMQQVFMNLALNAAEAIGTHDGLISVRTGSQTVDDAFLRQNPPAADLVPGKYVALEVRDTGCGMDDATRARIFDPFFSTKFTGRGLGLAAVAGIVWGHKGAILVRSSPGKGSSFTVLFPAGTPAGPVAQIAPRPALQGSGVVLVVDDEELVREMAKKSLERYGYTVLLADSGPAAIDLFKRHPADIALVLLDLSMPHMSGEETLPELRKIRPQAKVIISSGFSESETMTQFKGHHLSGFLQKPYTSAAIAEKVKFALS